MLPLEPAVAPRPRTVRVREHSSTPRPRRLSRAATVAAMRSPRTLALLSLAAGLCAWALLGSATMGAGRGAAVDWFGRVALWLLGCAVAVVSGHAARRVLPWTQQVVQPLALPGLILGYAAGSTVWDDYMVSGTPWDCILDRKREVISTGFRHDFASIQKHLGAGGVPPAEANEKRAVATTR